METVGSPLGHFIVALIGLKRILFTTIFSEAFKGQTYRVIRSVERRASRRVQPLLVPRVLDRDGVQSASHFGWDLGLNWVKP